jgi:hypothetical protein
MFRTHHQRCTSPFGIRLRYGKGRSDCLYFGDDSTGTATSRFHLCTTNWRWWRIPHLPCSPRLLKLPWCVLQRSGTSITEAHCNRRPTNRSVASMLTNPTVFCDSHPWANFVCTAHSEASLTEQSFATDENSTAKLIARRGNLITFAGDPSSFAQDHLPTIFTEVIPQEVEAAATHKGVRFIEACIRKLADWRAFFSLLDQDPISTKPKLLTYSGYGILWHFNGILWHTLAHNILWHTRSYSPTFLWPGGFFSQCKGHNQEDYRRALPRHTSTIYVQAPAAPNAA